MVVGTKVGKMIWLAAAGIIATLIILIFTSCASTPVGIFVAPVDRTYKEYLNKREHINADSVVAALSYSSAQVSRHDIRRWSQLEGLLHAYDTRLRMSTIADNYPVRLGTVDHVLYSRFIHSWLRSHKGRVKISDAPAKYVGDANNLIFRIINNEYNR